MAEISKYYPKLLKVEGGYVNHPNDKGGPTNKGVTLTTYRSFYGQEKTIEDLKNIKDSEVMHIYKVGYWDKCKADHIRNQSIAEIFVDFAVNSGVKTAARKVQAAFGLKADGIVGPMTLSMLNKEGSEKVAWLTIHGVRKSFYTELAKKPGQSVFLKGWMNRLNMFEYHE